jgi:hypothetical protein
MVTGGRITSEYKIDTAIVTCLSSKCRLAAAVHVMYGRTPITVPIQKEDIELI